MSDALSPETEAEIREFLTRMHPANVPFVGYMRALLAALDESRTENRQLRDANHPKNAAGEELFCPRCGAPDEEGYSNRELLGR